MASNYQDVLAQLHAAGLLVDTLRIDTPRMVRCRIEGDRERRGWYMLHEIPIASGELLIVGSYGIWRGNENNAQKIVLRKADALSTEQAKALKQRLADDRRRLDAERAREQARGAARAAAMWARLDPTGESEYLARKSVGAFGLRFTPTGSAVLPLLDAQGKIHGLQILRTAAAATAAKRPAKEFWPAGLAKKGHFHLIGSPQVIVLVAEGYATGASLHMATQLPVAIAFDAGNLVPVAETLHKRYPRARILVCGDDDCWTPGNPGLTSASAAAIAVGGSWILPKFADEAGRQAKHAANGHKITDFNDLHLAEGLHVVRAQIDALISGLNWSVFSAAPPPSSGERGGGKLKPIESVEEMIGRYSLIYGHASAAFDHREHVIVSLGDMRDLCIRRDIHKAWLESSRRDVVRIREVGFDPGGDDPAVTCNLYGGWPTTPEAGSCEKLLDLLRYMCSEDANPERLYDWVLRWIAYPVQHPGAKMKSTIVVHGPQGAGKNLFFEAVMSVYGEYGDAIDQSAIEDKFNDWASRKLFLLADEVVARLDLYHVKNKLKAFITGDRIRINPKNFAAYWERNHVNLVFLSNEAMPLVLEEDDRRHCVIWTPPKKPQDYYAAILAEIRNGGIAALHHHLLHLDLSGFDNGAIPPLTVAKSELIGLALDSPVRFCDEVDYGDLPGIRSMPALTADWYEVYKIWCTRQGMRSAPMPRFVNALARKRDVPSLRKRYQQAQSLHEPRAVLFMGMKRPPEGQREVEWLGNCIEDFRTAMKDYRGAT